MDVWRQGERVGVGDFSQNLNVAGIRGDEIDLPMTSLISIRLNGCHVNRCVASCQGEYEIHLEKKNKKNKLWDETVGLARINGIKQSRTNKIK